MSLDANAVAARLPGADRILAEIRERPDETPTRQLASVLGVPEEGFELFVERLFALQDEGRIVRLPGLGWTLPERCPFRVGRLTLTRKGHAYVEPVGDPEQSDYFIPHNSVGSAFDGDLVLVQERSTRGRKGRKERKERRGRDSGGRGGGRPRLPEARVVDVVRRREALVRGIFHVGAGPRGKRKPGYVTPIARKSFKDIFIDSRSQQGARDRQKVFVRLLDRGAATGEHAHGEIVHVVEEEGTLESDLLAIAAEFSLSLDHPSNVIEIADRLPPPSSPGQLQGREDLRDLVTLTIDPDDAKDFDDAISIEDLGEGQLRLGVHIADVSAYVEPDSLLDEAARERGTSVYLPGRVVPMLPARIADDLASLRPGVDRLTKSVFIDFDASGRRRATRICRSVIRSHRRFTYDEALVILKRVDPNTRDDPSVRRRDLPGLPEDAARFEDTLASMARLRDVLAVRRAERGCLDMEIPTLRLRLNERGEVTALGREGRDPSHQLIEEFMLAANEAVATYLVDNDLPLVARVHDDPDPELLDEFFDFLGKIDERFSRIRRSKEISHLQKIVESVREEPYGPIVQYQLLRSLSHAEYSAEPGLHFALATDRYCHFTSPIRRYPDLLVHQILEQHLQGRLRSRAQRARWRDILEDYAFQSSQAEKRAEKAEREMTKLRLIRYLEGSLGEEMVGLITAVLRFGFFIQVEDLHFDGFVHVTRLGYDYFEYDEAHSLLKGRQSQQTFRLGDRVRVVLIELDPDLREIHFELVEKIEEARKTEK